MTAPKRRWTRFLFVAVVAILLLLGWAGSNIYRVRQRQAMLAKDGVMLVPGIQPQASQLPAVWSFFGAKGVGLVVLDARHFALDDVARYQSMFPEAAINRAYPPPAPH